MVARLARDAGNEVLVCALRPVDSLSGDALTAARGWLESGGVVTTWPLSEDCEHDIIVDALLGTGFAGEVRSPMAEMIQALNEVPREAMVSIDVPSGFDCDTGSTSASTIRADLTISFVAIKRGFMVPDAGRWVGRVVVGEIGVPAALVDEIAAS